MLRNGLHFSTAKKDPAKSVYQRGLILATAFGRCCCIWISLSTKTFPSFSGVEVPKDDILVHAETEAHLKHRIKLTCIGKI